MIRYYLKHRVLTAKTKTALVDVINVQARAGWTLAGLTQNGYNGEYTVVVTRRTRLRTTG